MESRMHIFCGSIIVLSTISTAVAKEPLLTSASRQTGDARSYNSLVINVYANTF